jgi:protein TonB
VKGRSQRIFAVTLLLSLLAHAILLALLPADADPPASVTPQVLDVVLVEPEKSPASTPAAVPLPPSVPKLEDKTPPREERIERKKEKRDSQKKAPAPPAIAPAPVPSAPAEAPTAAAPQPEPAAPTPAPRAPPVVSIAPVPLTPPNFNAAYLRNPAPRYPPIARRNGEQGTVTLRVLVSRDGLPARVMIEKTSGSRHLDAAALETVQSWRFVPARSGAEPVEAWVLVPIVFRLESAS